MYYPDLEFTSEENNYYIPNKTAVYIGWLEPSEEEPTTGETSEDFKERIREICEGEQFLEESHRGWHMCPLCASGRSSRTFLISSSVEDKFYYFPGMVHHYVSEHNYKPPEEFVEAVMALNLKPKKSKHLRDRQRKKRVEKTLRGMAVIKDIRRLSEDLGNS